MSDVATERSAQVFGKYIENKRVLVVDVNASSRSSLFSIFKGLGAKIENIKLANNYETGLQMIQEFKPNIVVAEYDLEKRCGLELLQSQREQFPKETKESLFIVVTSNTSQSSAAKALEEDIDLYILKPYTLESIRSRIMKAAIQKIQPPAYLVSIEKGKEQILAGNLDEAENIFKEATTQDAAPSLALYYLGQIKFLRETMDQAESNYNKGLNFNKIHYKCLIGLYEAFSKQKKNVEAYEVVKKVSKYFPANPKRLSEVIRLAIVTGQYEDIERYYNLFVNLDDRNETLVRYTTAALIVTGKYYLSQKTNSRAIALFEKAAITAQGRTNLLTEIISALLDYSLGKEAQQFLKRFPPETQGSDDFLAARFLVADSLAASPTAVLDEGRKLIAKSTKNERVYYTVMLRSIQAKLYPAAEDVYSKAIQQFPKSKEKFDELLEALEKKKKAA
ncbi:MAG: response regulator [Bacteriovoracia bacterium]